MLKSGIYKITNIINGRVYVGQSRNLAKRRYAHFYKLRKNEHRNCHLQNAFNTYGEKAFIFEVLIRCETNELDFYEEFYMKKYNSLEREFGYNLMKTEHKNYIHSLETKLKISEKHKGKILSEEQKRRISIGNLGKKMSKEAVKNMSLSRKGKRQGEENTQSIIDNDLAKEILIFLKTNKSLSLKEVADKFQTTYDVVVNLKDNKSYKEILKEEREYIKDFYLKNNPFARTRLKEGQLVVENDKVLKALELYDIGISQNKISKQLNISRNTLRKAIQQRQVNTEITKESKKSLVS